jgi:hypothetical protein
MIVLDKDIIIEEILSHFPKQKRGFPPKVHVHQMITAILYKLKAGCQ